MLRLARVHVVGKAKQQLGLSIPRHRYGATARSYASSGSNPKQIVQPIKKLLCANRGEIAIRVFRAAEEMNIRTVGIYTNEDRLHTHRYKADESYMIGKGKNPVAAYLAIDDIIKVAQENNVDAIHPGYGFLSESAPFAQACADAGIKFVGPSVEVLRMMGDKTEARKVAVACGVPVIPGSDGPVRTFAKANEVLEELGYPVILKAAFGGGGRGMRIVRAPEEAEEAFNRCQSEAQAAFGDPTVFIERYVERPKHIEVQILGDKYGDIVHLFERDCSIQRRHQKVVEMAPATGVDQAVRNALINDSLKIARYIGYQNAGTFEFLIDSRGRHYFIEVNPRIQVEHTVTEEITGIDLVQSQIRIAEGRSLRDLNVQQGNITARGTAVQCRVTCEDPENNFTPDYGKLEVFRPGEGMGIRLDSAGSFAGLLITSHYDSLLSKVTSHAITWDMAVAKLRRALKEFRVRGVKTNVPFLMNLLHHPDFLSRNVSTSFIDDNPQLFVSQSQNRAQKLLMYLASMVVNGPNVAGATPGVRPAAADPIIPALRTDMEAQPKGLRQVLLDEGPKAFAKRVRENKGLLLTDTTWRDAHQSLLATRVRTKDLVAIAPATAQLFHNFYSLEMWGGATFDVALRFLHEDPWDRLARLRELVPNVPFQMLLRGANAVGYTSYPDNVVYRFCKKSRTHGVDVFRVFDSLNYFDNLALGIDAVGEAGGVIEAAICYTGDVSDPNETKYSLDYYLDLARKLVDRGIHVLCIKDMAGLLRPQAATILIGALRKEFPDVPIHVHTHDTANTGVASMLACAWAGADAVDVALDAMSGLTAQPSMGAVVASLKNTQLDTGVPLEAVTTLNDYWLTARGLYAPFESGQKSAGADVYDHEMPGGQYTNLLFQAQSLGLASEWPEIKKSYAAANRVLGNIVKVTPTSKVVGDLAQFMVQNKLTEESVVQQAASLNFPSSVVEFLQGYLGEPAGGFPEPFRTNALQGKSKIVGRPGASLPEFNFDKLRQQLQTQYKERLIRDEDLLSSVMYPKVFEEYMTFRRQYSDVSVLPTRYFLTPPSIGEEISFDIEQGKTLIVKLLAVGELDESGNRQVFFEVNGLPRVIMVPDAKVSGTKVTREKATDKKGSVGAPMPGVIVDLRVKEGQYVRSGAPLAVLSAMKMETVVSAPCPGVVKRLQVKTGDNLKAGDLLLEIEPPNDEELLQAEKY